MGSAIECFDDSGAVVVPRDRFAPVKTCNDLFALRSDAFKARPDASVLLCMDSSWPLDRSVRMITLLTPRLLVCMEGMHAACSWHLQAISI